MPPRRTPVRRSTKTYLFSYGSNSPRQLAERLGHAVTGRAAFVDGYLRAFRGWSNRWEGGVATLIPGRGKTYGYIAEVTPADLAVLDRYEGVATGNYRRQNMTVTTNDGDTVEAIAYLASSTEKNAPSRAYKRAVAETIGAFWEGSNGPVTEEDITVRNNPRGKVKRFGKPLPFRLPAQARDLYDPRTQTLTLSKDMFDELVYASKLLALDDESVPLNRREKAYIYMLGGAKERGGLVVLPVTKPAALFMLGEGSPLDVAMDIASGEVDGGDARRRARARRTFHGMKQISEALYKTYILPHMTVNPRPQPSVPGYPFYLALPKKRNPASNLFYHATLAGKNNEILASLAAGIDPSLSKGFGQGAGFYLWASRDRALQHLGSVVSGEGLNKEVAVAGEPILVVMDVPLTPEDFDIDYEVYGEGFLQFVRDNAAWFEKNASRLVFPFSVYDDGEFADATFKVTPNGLLWRIGTRRKGMSFDSDMHDTGTARLLSAFASRLAEVAPEVFRRFEAEVLPRSVALKYVGPRVQPLRIERPDGTVLWKRGDAVPRTNPNILKNPRQRGLDVRRGIPGTYRTRYTAKGGKVRAYPAHDGAEWDRTMTRLASETTVAGKRIYDTVKRAEQAGRATVPGKRGAVEVVRVTNPQRRPVYHLTYASDLPSIARQGLVPRADTETAWNNAPGVYFVSTFGYEAGAPESEEPAWLCFPAPATTPPRFFDGGMHEACVNATIPPEVIKVWVDERGRPVSSSDKGRWKPLVR